MLGIAASFTEMLMIRLGLGRQRHELHHDLLASTLTPLSQEFLLMFGVSILLVPVIATQVLCDRPILAVNHQSIRIGF